MLTVIFATRNGMRTLPAVLDAYMRLEVPAGGWKVVVVDNASTDGSRDCIRSFQEKLPLTYLYEEKLGKNSALNSALAHVDGDLVVLTDDDAFPRPDWLLRLRSAADAQPSYSIFGGVVLPRWEIDPPDWLTKWVPLQPVYTLTPPSLHEGGVDHHFVVGPNMAVRAKLFEQGFRFDPTIGPRGASYAMGSETEFVKRLARHGFAAWHVHDATVEHFIRDYQMKSSWILRRGARFGRGLYRMGRLEGPAEIPAWLGIPRHLFRDAITQTARLLKGVLTFSGETTFRARWELNVLRGQFIEAYNERGDAVGTKSHSA